MIPTESMVEHTDSEVADLKQDQIREKTDAELVAAARAGDEAAFARLFEKHKSLVSRLAYRFFSRREQVEEIIQESFIKAYFALDSYQG